MTRDFTEECIKTMAKKCIAEEKTFEYMMFWLKEPEGWQKKAKKILLEELKKKN